MATEMCEISCEILTASDEAVLIYDGIVEQWIPFSCCEDEPRQIQAMVGTETVLRVAYWFAKREGLI